MLYTRSLFLMGFHQVYFFSKIFYCDLIMMSVESLNFNLHPGRLLYLEIQTLKIKTREAK